MNSSPLFKNCIRPVDRKSFALVVLSSLIFTAVAETAPVSYTSEYTGTALPAPADGTIANPAWFNSASEGSQAAANGGVLFASTMSATGSNSQFWLIGEHDDQSTYGTNQAWSVDSSVGFTVDFSVQILSVTGTAPNKAGGFMIQVSDGSRVGTFFFGTDAIYYSGASQYGTSMPLNLTTGFTTFRITGQNGSYSLYMEDMDEPLFDNLLGGTLPGYNRLIWGDFDQSLSGSYNLGFVGWSNQTAEFSAPPAIPEPATAMLLIGGVGAGLAILRKNR